MSKSPKEYKNFMVNLYGIQNAAVICTRNNPEMNGNASNKGNSDCWIHCDLECAQMN